MIGARMIEDAEIKTSGKPDFTGAQAIVVLGGGIHPGDGDKVSDTLGPWSLERVVFGAAVFTDAVGVAGHPQNCEPLNSAFVEQISKSPICGGTSRPSRSVRTAGLWVRRRRDRRSRPWPCS